MKLNDLSGQSASFFLLRELTLGNLTQSEEQGLTMLYVSKRLCKVGFRVLQTTRAMAQQVIRRSIEGIPEEQGSNIDRLTGPRRTATSQQRDKMLNMFLKDLRIHNAIPREHGPEELSRARPHLAIRDKDTIT